MHSNTSGLQIFGWTPRLESAFRPLAREGSEAGRVSAEDRGAFRLYTADGEIAAETGGRLAHRAACRADLPAVGDWVAFQRAPGGDLGIIRAILPRSSAFLRKATGRRAEEQVVGANIDTVFLVAALSEDFNSRRMERYLAAAWDSGAAPVILLTKADLSADPGPAVAAMESAAPGVPVHPVSVLRPSGFEAVLPYLTEGRTAALLGSSGVGKSSLVNALLGEERMAVREIREWDGRGRHATVRRELVLLPRGGLILDTPGMRLLQPWTAGTGLAAVFEDIEALARQCFFGDCRHAGEPRCAVQAALRNGSLAEDRLEAYRKLQRESKYLERRKDDNARRIEEERWKKISRLAKKISDEKRRFR